MTNEEFQTKENELKRLRKLNHLYKKAKDNAEKMAANSGEDLNQAQYEISALKKQLVAREKQVMKLKEADKAQGKEIVQLKSQLQQQALPVVPECVAEFVSGDENELSKADRIAYLLKSVEGDNYYLEEYLTNAEIISQEQGEHLYAWATNQNHETILKLWNGYTVEKPQLFRLKLKNATISNYYLWLNHATGKVFVDKKFLDWTNHDNVKNIFTEQEIAKISDGAFVNNEAFELVPVEEEE